MLGDDGDGMGVEVVPKLPLADEDGVNHLLDVEVARLGLSQYFADVVDRVLDLQRVSLLLAFHHESHTYHLSGCRHVQEEPLSLP